MGREDEEKEPNIPLPEEAVNNLHTPDTADEVENGPVSGNEGRPAPTSPAVPMEPLRLPNRPQPLLPARGNGLNVGGAHAIIGMFTPRQQRQYISENGAAELESEDAQSSDPFALQKRPTFKLQRKLVFVTAAVPIASWIILFVCFGVDKLTEPWAPGKSYSPADLTYSVFTPDVDQGRSILEAILNTMSVIFGLLITVIGIILQLSANRFTSHVTALFFRDTTIGLALSYVVFCNAFGFWVYLSISDTYVPRASVVLSLLMVTSHLLLIFPFLAYLFYFLEPDKVVTTIMMAGLNAASESVNNHGKDIEKQQVKATLAVEHLMDAAGSALKKKDKNITAEIVDALCSFTIHYGLYKDQMNAYWFAIPIWIRQSPDFLTLSDEAIDDIQQRKTWIEWKILRQYQLLFNESLKHMKELCYHISMNTRIMGEAAGKVSDYPTLDLTIKFFNTFLRASININDVRTVYNVLFQYRKLAEFIIKEGCERSIDENVLEETELESRAVRIAKFMRYYSFCCLGSKLSFLVEVISHDIRVLCETAFLHNSVIHDKLLDIFLTQDDGSDIMDEKATQGVRRAQVSLATTYLVHNNTDYPQKLADYFAEVDHKKLWSLLKELQNVSLKEFWEVSERGTNFTFLTPEQKAKLPVFFSTFKNFKSEHEIPMNPSERKKFERQQALLNFE